MNSIIISASSTRELSFKFLSGGALYAYPGWSHVTKVNFSRSKFWICETVWIFIFPDEIVSRTSGNETRYYLHAYMDQQQDQLQTNISVLTQNSRQTEYYMRTLSNFYISYWVSTQVYGIMSLICICLYSSNFS